ncbi:hypothetical protein ZWY2020_024749 [Hordeum vulgare]|nr:hypothetical protein ZWY2020_024749 [Hordeum vulgare]
MSEIERDQLSLQEVKGFLNDHMQLKESMKLYFQVPGKSMADGLMFLHDDRACLQMGEYTDVGGVADIFVEYHGEEDSENSRSGSDFEMDEMVNLSDADEPALVISAEPAGFSDDDVQFVQEVLVPDDSGVITQIISSHVKHIHVDARARRVVAHQVVEEQVQDGSQVAISQVLNPAAHASGHGTETPSEAQPADLDSDSDSDPGYLAHSEDSGENSEVVELRRHARKFKKKMRDTKSWIGRDTTEAVPLELIANMEEQLEADDKQWGYDSSDEDYSYDEDSDGQQSLNCIGYCFLMSSIRQHWTFIVTSSSRT